MQARWVLGLATWAVVMSSLVPQAHAGPTTALRSWSPGADATFKTAAVCHDVTRDVYVIAAVFDRYNARFGFRWDALYRLRVEGNSARSGYGELLETPAHIRSEGRIDHVDCASDDANNVYVAMDRYLNNAVWFRFDATTTHGPYEVPRYWCNPYTHRPRIAYGNGRVMVAFDGHHFDTGGDSCEMCVAQFNPTTGAVVAGTQQSIWNDNMTHSDFDVEWNGSDRFILALPYDIDAGQNFLSTYGFMISGTMTAENVLQNFSTTASPAYPSRTRIVFSDNARASGRMIVQTNTGSYWTNRNGVRVGTPLVNAVGTTFAACEYWGADAAASTLLTQSLRGRYVPGIPSGHFELDHATMRSHYGLSPASAYENANVNLHYYPVACDGAGTYGDPEVVVISKTPLTSSPNVTWNILAND